MRRPAVTTGYTRMASASDATLLQRTLKNSASGTVAGVAVCLVGHPFDTLKVRLQTQPVNNPVYRGLADCFIKTLKWEGIGGLYKGVGSPIVGQMFFRAIMFTSYYQTSTFLAGTGRHRLTHPEYFMCGSVTGAVSAFVEGPIDLFKTKMQIQIIQAKATGASMKYRNVFHAGYIITRAYGLKGAYQGLQATLVRNTIACAYYFGFYEIMRDHFTPEGGTVNDLKVWQLLIAGGTGGFTYWSLTYPTDVIKSALQSDHSEVTQRKYAGYFDCARQLYANEGGWRRFFRGFTPCLMRSIPANSAMLLVLEKCRQLFP